MEREGGERRAGGASGRPERGPAQGAEGNRSAGSQPAEERLIVEDSVLTGEEHDPDFVAQIIRYGGQDVQTCLQCGNCTGVCPVSLKTPYKTRNLIKLCQYGYKKIFFSIPWICAGCHRCYEHCPADINPSEVFVAIRHIQVRERGVPRFIRDNIGLIVRNGFGAVPSDDIRRYRERQGLEPLPNTLPGYGRALEELAVIFRRTGFDRLIGLEGAK
ncbi:MAG: 4Fe-4S dicluster domain-containing protein [Thermoplasmatota archaeon]